MPIYEYRCKDCEHDFTIIESLKDHEGLNPTVLSARARAWSA